MDGSAAAASRKDDSENYSRSDDGTCENGDPPSTEDSGDGVGVFCCQDCGAAFSKEAACMEHRHQHHQQNMYLDSQSDGLPNTEKDNETTHFCSVCSLSFVEMSELHLHMKNKHPISQMSEFVNNSGLTKQQNFECSECGKSYTMIGHYLNHLRCHTKPAKSLLHNLEHLKKKSFQCEFCGRSYSRASALDAHRRCHEENLVKSKGKSSEDLVQTGESEVETKPSESVKEEDSDKCFKCICGRTFSTASRLKTHQRFNRSCQCSPEKNKPKAKKNNNEFYCSECNKSFSSHIAFYSHQRRHSNASAERFPCEECGKVFMTLTFYYRHQRMAHSVEAPAKSFLHQVCQVQKKAFECNDCGLKFSRASALQSHQLQHTDAFRETEKSGQLEALSLHQDKESDGGCKKTDHSEASLEEKVQLESFPAACVVDESHINEADEDVESYEPGDFNVQVISDSESEEEATQDLNPDLELLCESDHDIGDDTDDEVYPGNLVSKPGMNLKIIQIDFNQASEQCSLMESEDGSNAAETRFDCPDCYRWFTNPVSLRVHRMWHGVRERRQQTQANESSITCKDCGLKFTHPDAYKTHLHQHALDEEESQLGDSRPPAADVDTEENQDETMSGVANGDDSSSSVQMQPPEATASVENASKRGFTCQVCGKGYAYLVSYEKHLKLHDESYLKELKSQEKQQPDPNLREYECPDCGMSFIRRTRLISHLRVHRSRRRLELTPIKCEQCNKSFTTVKSWMGHVQLHNQRRFWCLSCAEGFFDEISLDKHLQSHGLKQNNQSTEDEISLKESPRHPKVSSKIFQCKYCEKTFHRARGYAAHAMWHIRRGTMGKPLEDVAPVAPDTNTQDVKNEQLTEGTEEADISVNAEELPEDGTQSSGGERSFDEAKCGDPVNSEESDCGEPLHCISVSKSPNRADHSSESVQSPAGLEQEQKVHREHKYWEWECIECDMGFDEIAKLHLHYVQHATGEVPLLQEDIEG